MKKNELYIAPEVEVVNVVVEKGFAASPDTGDWTGDDPQGEGAGF